MNYRTYRTLVLIAALLLVGVAATLSVQPQWAKAASADATSFAPQQKTFSKVAFKAHNAKYVAAEGGGGRELVANRDEKGPWETFSVEIPNSNEPDVFALKASNGLFVSAEGGGGRELVANRKERGPWETFRLVRPGTSGLVAIQTYNGKFYVSAEGPILRANRQCAGEWENFSMEAW
jgi:hypothetical protein